MNFRFWKKKPVAEQEGKEVTDKTVAADEADPKPAKPGWFARLKSALKPSRKKKDDADNKDERETRPEHGSDDHKDHKPPRPHKTIDGEDEESKPARKGFLVRLKDTLHLSRKKGAPDEEGLPEHPAKRADKKTPDAHHKKPAARELRKSAEEEIAEQSVHKHGKKKWLILALLILLIGGGLAAWKWLLPSADHKPPTAAQNPEKPGEAPASEPTEAAALSEAAEKAQAEATAMAEAAEKAQAEAAAQAEAVAQAKAEAEAAAQAKAAEQAEAATPASTDANVQAQLEALRKQNQEMQTQLEALKNQRHPPARSAGATARSPGEVLIINGKNTKESTQGLKQVIEEMNAASGLKREQKPAK